MTTTAIAPADNTETHDQLRDCETLELSLERARLQKSFYAFVQAAWPVIETSQSFTPNWHIEILCRELQEVALGKGKNGTRKDRWVFNIPPGTLKSLLISVLFPAWVWARDPKKRFLVASYGSHLSIRDNIRSRDLVLSPWYQSLFPVHLAEDQDTKTRYNTAEGGWRIATSVGGPGTGEHPDFIIIDDPLSAQQAESAAERKTANDWIDRTLSSRGITRATPVCLFLVMQRLHKNDPTAHLLEQGDVEHVCFPMRYMKSRPKTDEDEGYTADPRDPRTEEGELLIPALLDEEAVRKLEKRLGAYATAGQLQQQPAPEGGGLFKAAWFKILDVAPKDILREARGWDTAATEDDGDWTVGAKIAEFGPKGGMFVVLDVVRGQVGPNDQDAMFLNAARADGKECAQREEREGGSAGKVVISARAKALVGYDYSGVSISGSKIVRAKPFRSQCEAGNVYLVRGAWNAAYISELSNFPTGDHDDQVDASSAAFNAVLLEPRRKKQWAVLR